MAYVPLFLALGRVSDSGSGARAASSAHVRSDAVSLTARSALTSPYISHQVCYPNVCAVRDEEAAGSNPATPTSSEAMSGDRTWPLLYR